VDLAASRDEPAVASLLDDAAATIGMTVANLATFLDPERVVLGGGMATAFVPAIAAAVTRAVPFPPLVETGRFVNDAPLIGALALAVEAL
jgi:glucokinase